MDLKSKKIRIGFPLSRGGGGPTIFMRRLRNAIKKHKIAVASYFIDPLTDVLICANIVRNPWKKPYVLRVDGIAFDIALGDEEINRRNAPIFKGIDNASGIVFQSKFAYELVTAFYTLPVIPMVIIPNGADLMTFSPDGENFRNQLGIENDELVFMSSAKWRAHKRLDATISAYTQFSKTVDYKTRLLILGEVTDQPTEIPDTVTLIGHIEAEKLPDWYRTADIFLFFSWLDNCPNTVIEALASGLPVVCTNQGGVKELIELTNGGIVAQADEPFTFKKVQLYQPPQPDMQALLESIYEVVDRRQEIISGMKRENIGIDTIARKYVEFLETVARKGSRQ